MSGEQLSGSLDHEDFLAICSGPVSRCSYRPIVWLQLKISLLFLISVHHCLEVGMMDQVNERLSREVVVRRAVEIIRNTVQTNKFKDTDTTLQTNTFLTDEYI